MSKIKKRPPSSPLGPVSDLEKHLPAEWWKNLFNSYYLKTDGDVVENAAGTSHDVDLLLNTLKLSRTDRILDLCCGQGRHAIELASRGFGSVQGIDRSRYLVRLARKRAQQLKLSIKFSEGDARKIQGPDSQFDCIYLMGNSFGYFERPEDDVITLEGIKRTLASNGKLALDITDGEWIKNNYDARSWEWIDQDYFVCRERSLSADSSRLITREVIVHSERGVIVDQFYAERLYSQEQIGNLLEDLEFTSIDLHGSFSSLSTRGQDLGMMQRRLFITAKAPTKQQTREKSKAHRICVVMGDPKLPDTVKHNGVFNPEDMVTIDRLKEALKDLKHCSFKYVDQHATLYESIKEQAPDFVFNLCDEGYLNDAQKELHVPALLEMMNIHYTGAAPAALAVCYNKSIVRSIALGLDIPVPDETYFDPTDLSASIPSIFPAIVKPNLGDSSIGITQHAVVHKAEELIAHIRSLQQQLPGIPLLIQEFLSGEEYSVGIIGNASNYTILPILCVDYSHLPKELPQILGYESKWEPNSPYWNAISYKQAEISEDLQRKLIDASIKLFERTGCRDYARFDFRMSSDGVAKLLEVNPNPGWCWDGKLNMMAEFMGMSYPELLDAILRAGLTRCGLIK
ncbi:MAG: methyltransferase domain-containing protein [Chlamydiia bacterium]|nr:methyltransferase domain-containing protein [Chlamydiia bacterium]